MNRQILESAAEWLVEFRCEVPGADARKRFAQWLRTSPEHIRAYLEVLALWEDARPETLAQQPDADELIRLAREDPRVTGLHSEEITVPPGRSGRVNHRPWHSRLGHPMIAWRGVRLRTAVAILASLLINGAVTWLAVDPQTIAYATPMAQPRSVALPDGSQVDLDALTRISGRFTDAQRTLDLKSGQALFKVSKDPQRPFIVRINDIRVRAVGTEFNVNQTTLGTVVTVLEGRVSVSRVDAAASPSASGSPPARQANEEEAPPTAEGVQVAAGQQTTVTQGRIGGPQAVDPSTATTWKHQIFDFRSIPLPVVAEEFNRFNQRQIMVKGSALADIHITGAFSASGPEALDHFAAFLRTLPGIEVVETSDSITVRNAPAP